MRVLHLSWEYPPVVYGGLGRHVHALAEAQVAAGHDVVVVTQHAGEGVATDRRVNGVRVVSAPYDAPRFSEHEVLAWVRGLNHAFAKAALDLGHEWRPEVVHAHDWMVADAGATLRAGFGVPLVATVHATEAGRHQGWLPSELSKQIHHTEWWLTFEARRVIACSQHMRWEVTRLFELPTDKVDVVPNGIDLAAWTARRGDAAAARRRLAPEGPMVLMVGRLEWEKGAHTLLEAMPRLRRRFPGLRLVLVGDGSQRSELEALARSKRVSRSVTFTGWLSDVDVRAVTAAADVSVVPSVYEPFGLVALEAAALGTALVVAATGGLIEFVDDGVTGLRVPPLDPAALADAVTTVLDDDLLARRLVRNARTRLVRDHTWHSVAERTTSVYEQAVAEERTLRASQRTRPRLRAVLRDGNLLREEP
jgi:glycogen(starch) synthase